MTACLVAIAVAGGVAACGGVSSPAAKQTDLATAHKPFHASRGTHRYTSDQLQPGDVVRCGMAGATVQKPGQGVGAFADGVTSSSDLQVTTNADDTVDVDCSMG